jgi:hypothetical protein
MRHFQSVGVCEEETPAEKGPAFYSADEEEIEFGRMGKILKTHFRISQDTELSVDEDFKYLERIMLL